MSQCNVCQSTQLLDYGTKNQIPFKKCAHCGYIWASPMPTQDELDQLYSAEHFNSSYNPEANGEDKLFELRKLQYVQDVEHILEFCKSGKLLDFGCGNGLFLDAYPKQFAKTGYEFNDVTTQFLQENRDFRVIPTYKDLQNEDQEQFDLISMRGVIEHLIDPFEKVQTLCSKLKVGGHFYICATPNADSAGSLVGEMNWSQFTPPYHLHHFSPRTLSLIMAQFNLALIDYRLPYLGTPYENQEEDSQNWIKRAKGYRANQPAESIPPLPGTMMSLVFQKVQD